MRAGYPVADTLGGMAASFAISSALVERGSTGKGSVIDVSMLETAITAMGWVVSNFLVAGQPPVPMGNENFTAAPSGTFMTGEGRINISANKQEQFEALCRYVGREELASDPRFAKREARKTNRAELKLCLEEALAQRTAQEWEDGFSTIGVPAGRVLDIDEVLGLPQVQERGLVHQVPNPVDGDRQLSVLGNGVRINDEVSTPAAGPPLLGEHTDEILREIGLEQTHIDSLRDQGGIS